MNLNTRSRLMWAAAGLLVPSAWLLSDASGADESEIVYTARQPMKVRAIELSGKPKIKLKSPPVSTDGQVIEQVQAEETPVQRELRAMYEKDGRPVPDGAMPVQHKSIKHAGTKSNQSAYTQDSETEPPEPGGYPTSGPAPQKKPSIWSKMVPSFLRRQPKSSPAPAKTPAPKDPFSEPGESPPPSQYGQRGATSTQPYQSRGQYSGQYTRQPPTEPVEQPEVYQTPNRLRQSPQRLAPPIRQPSSMAGIAPPAIRPRGQAVAEGPELQDELLIDESGTTPADEPLMVLEETPIQETPRTRATGGPRASAAPMQDEGETTLNVIAEPLQPDIAAPGESESPFSGQKVDLSRETELAHPNPQSRYTPETSAEPGQLTAPDGPQLTEGETPKLLSPAEEIEGLKGYCVVTLKTDRKLVGGQKDYSLTYRNHIYRFASKEAMAEFERNPDTYAPAHNGRDVVRMSDGKEDVPGNIDHAVWYRGRLFMFSNAESQTAFVSAPGKFAATVTKKK